jgi:hypothetical protein
MMAAASEAHELAIAVVQFLVPRFVVKRNPANRCKSNCWRDLNFRRLLSVSATSQARDHAGKPLKHFLPADLRSPECLFAPRLGDVKAGMLEEDASSVAVGFESVAYPHNDARAVCKWL